MHKHVAFGMKLLRLQYTFHHIKLGQNRLHQSAGIQEIPAAHAIGRNKNPHQFVTNSLRTDLIDRGRIGHECLPRFAVDLVTEHRRKPHSAQHAQPILGKPLRRLANRAHQFCIDVGAAADKIDHVICNGIIKHSVDREIAA